MDKASGTSFGGNAIGVAAPESSADMGKDGRQKAPKASWYGSVPCEGRMGVRRSRTVVGRGLTCGITGETDMLGDAVDAEGGAEKKKRKRRGHVEVNQGGDGGGPSQTSSASAALCLRRVQNAQTNRRREQPPAAPRRTPPRNQSL